MKQIKIIETDATWIEQFLAFALEQGAKATADPSVLQVSDDFDTDLHGIEAFDPEAPAPKSFREEFSDVIAWLEGYNGTFDFYLSLKSQLAKKGELSPKQVDAVIRAIEREAAYKEQKVANAVAPANFSVKVGQILMVNRTFARKIAIAAGYARPHYTFEILEVLGETARAYKVKVKMVAFRTSHCCVCGLFLENPQSVIAGIGPVCAGNWGVTYGDRSLLELTMVLQETVAVTAWIPKAAVKETYEGVK